MRFPFALLAGALSVSAAAKDAASPFAAELPFRDCDGLICIDVALDGGKPRTLMLDTGNASSTLLSEVARELNWKLDPAMRGSEPVPGIFRGGEHRVALGALQSKADFFVFDRALLGEHRPPVDGSIAYDFFKDRVLEIDYPRHRLRISNVLTAAAERGDGAGSLKMIGFGERGPATPVASGFTLDGKPLRARIDTVFTGTLLVYDGALARLGLAKSGKPEFFAYTDAGVNLLAAPAPKIAFDGRALTPKSLYFPTDGGGLRQPDGLFDATAGNALFARSVVTLDFHAMTMKVKPAK